MSVSETTLKTHEIIHDSDWCVVETNSGID